MVCTAKHTIDIARRYVGYHEESNNHVPFLEEIFANYPQMDRCAAWCDKFFDGIIVMACDFDYDYAEHVLCGKFDDYTPISANYYKDAGRYGQEPNIGAQIFFRNAEGICHTGIVTGFDDETVYTIEGNANDEVRVKNYDRNDWKIDGYGYPRYDEESEFVEMNDFQCLIKPDGKEYMIWYDGTDFHDLDHPDEMTAIQMFYKMMTGNDITVFEFGSKEAPWFHRLQDAQRHFHDYEEHM